MTITGGRLIRAMLDDEDGHSESTNALHFCVEGNLRMNERIRQLAERAGFIHFSPDEDSDTSIDWSCDYTQELAKFAELIIEECAEMGDNFDGQPAGNAVREYLTAGDAIREYFGVETNE